MKEKQVRLTAEEIDYLLKGSILWDDIEPRVEVPLRKPIEPRVEAPSGKPIKSSLEDSMQDFRLKDLKVENSRIEEDVKLKSRKFEEDQEGDSVKPFLEGRAVYWVLSGVSFLTLGTWIYFVFAG